MTGLWVALGLFSRLPAPHVDADADAVARATRWAPWVGAILGGLAMLPLYAAPFLGETTAVLTVAVLAVLTGALHLDGVGDCADGLGVQGDRAKVLAVMHDPRLGGVGVVGLVLHLLLKVTLVAGCTTQPAAVLVACVVARAPVALELATGPAATPGQGLFGALAGRVRGRDSAAGLAAGGLGLCGAWALGGPAAALAAGACALAGTVVWHRLWRRRIGGLTGDVVGAAIELRELAVLAALVASGV